MAVKITPAKALIAMQDSIDHANKVLDCQIPPEIRDKWGTIMAGQRSIRREAMKKNEKFEEIKDGKL